MIKKILKKQKKIKLQLVSLNQKLFFELKKFSIDKDVICILIDNFGTNLPTVKTFFMFKKQILN